MAHLRRQSRSSASPIRTALLQLAAAGAIAIAIAIAIAAGRSKSRELRPSDHGLDSMADPGPSTAEMRSFFGGATAADNLVLPEARINSTGGSDDWEFWAPAGRGGGVHVRLVLLLVCVVCGGAGLALLLAAAVFCFLRRRQKSTIN